MTEPLESIESIQKPSHKKVYQKDKKKNLRKEGWKNKVKRQEFLVS